MTVLSRRAAMLMVTALAGIGLTQAIPQASAQTYPTRQVKVVVPFAAGGPTDVMARLIAQKLSESLKQQFYVENHPGAGGNIGMTIVARANPDGYTILVASSSFVVNPSLYAKNPYDAFTDFEPVTLAAASPNILVVNPELPVKTVKELVDLMKANPYKYSVANPGIGTTPQLAAELFKLALKLEATSVPFGGAAPAIQSTVAGHTQIAFAAMPPAAPQVTGGKLRALAVTSPARTPAFPEIPTLREAGIPDQEADLINGMVAPAGTPPEIIALLQKQIAEIVQLPDFKATLDKLSFQPVGSTSAQFADQIKNDIVVWSKVMKDANIPVN